MSEPLRILRRVRKIKVGLQERRVRLSATNRAVGLFVFFDHMGPVNLKANSLWWNYVSTDRQRIAKAARRWEEGGFDPIPGETQRVTGPEVTFQP
ncbi:MAG: hypothetical protein Q7K57_39680 [Burkholderiaceae bacterium]|nr:hypothetical protein [Burkholderiaceae bacterium]